MLVYMY